MFIPEAPDRILVVKLSSFGDIIHATPCLRALRDTWPEAVISMAVEQRWAAVVQGNPNLDRVIEAPSQLRLTPRYARTVRRRLVEEGPFDVAIDLQGTRRSALWVYLSGAPVKAGRGRPRPGWHTAVAPDLTLHAVEVCARVGRALGLHIPDPRPEVFPDRQQEEAVEALLERGGLPPEGWILLNPFSRWRSKSWPAADDFLKCLQHPVVITGGPAEQAEAEQLEREGVVSVAGKLSLAQALCLYRRARLMVSCDSGPMHAAAALGVPVVGLFGPTHPERTGPWGQEHCVVQGLRPERHSTYRRDPEARYMRALAPEPVLQAVERMLAQTSDHERSLVKRRWHQQP